MKLQEEYLAIKDTILKRYPNVKGEEKYIIIKDIKLIKIKDWNNEVIISRLDLIKLVPTDFKEFLVWVKLNNKAVFKIMKDK